MASKNNPDHRQPGEIDRSLVLFVDNGKKKICRKVGNQIVDKQGNVVHTIQE